MQVVFFPHYPLDCLLLAKSLLYPATGCFPCAGSIDFPDPCRTALADPANPRALPSPLWLIGLLRRFFHLVQSGWVELANLTLLRAGGQGYIETLLVEGT